MTASDLADVDYFEKNYRPTSLSNGKGHWPKLDFSHDLARPLVSELSALRSLVYLGKAWASAEQGEEKKSLIVVCFLFFILIATASGKH